MDREGGEKNIVFLKKISVIQLKKDGKTQNIGKKVIDKLKITNCRTKNIEIETERRNKLSIIAKNNKLGGYVKGCGRGKSGWYKKYWCDSSWELAFVIYCQENGIEIERNKEKFEYIYKDKKLNYIPDFKIGEEFVEIKGYYTQQFEAKKQQFPHFLKVYGKNEMKPILEFVIDKYGKNFIELYE